MNPDLSKILIMPHITEKATVSSESSVYVFKVAPNSTKTLIEKAFQNQYKVKPLKVSTVTIPSKKVIVRGKRGISSGYKKAYIYIKKGEKIDIMK